MKKIYIAGPDVFERHSIEIGENYVQLCAKYGFEGHYPLDNVIDFKQEKNAVAMEIYMANKNLLDECDVVIANLNPFRGKEADSGTVWECGYAQGIGKKVYGYMSVKRDYVEGFASKKEEDGIFWDEDDRFIEDFGHPLNLMIACSVLELVEGGFEDVLRVMEA